MIDERIVIMCNAAMAGHTHGAFLFLGSLFVGKYATKDHNSDALDGILASAKRNIIVSRQEKEEIHCKEFLKDMLKQ
jgi:hypothetical protein